MPPELEELDEPLEDPDDEPDEPELDPELEDPEDEPEELEPDPELDPLATPPSSASLTGVPEQPAKATSTKSDTSAGPPFIRDPIRHRETIGTSASSRSIPGIVPGPQRRTAGCFVRCARNSATIAVRRALHTETPTRDGVPADVSVGRRRNRLQRIDESYKDLVPST
jgi:hypothetical protein